MILIMADKWQILRWSPIAWNWCLLMWEVSAIFENAELFSPGAENKKQPLFLQETHSTKAGELDDIVFTNKRLAKIGYVLHDTCTFCKIETETIYHLFYKCPFTLLFWEKFENFWFVLSGKREKFMLQDVYIGKLETVSYRIIL